MLSLDEMFHYFVSNDVLNIFTDASIKRIRKENSFVGCPGMVSYIGYQELSKRLQLLNFSTNNLCHIYFLLKHLEYLQIPLLEFETVMFLYYSLQLNTSFLYLHLLLQEFYYSLFYILY